MKKLNRLIPLLFAILIILTSCSGLEVTEDMQKAMDTYIDAVAKTETKDSGKITVTSILNDEALEYKKTESVIDFEYTVTDGKVTFNRTDSVDGNENSIYVCDGETVKEFDYDNSVWIDKTAENKNFMVASSNPFTTLSLFRVDNNLKIRTDYLSDIKAYREEEFEVVEFTLKNDSVTELLDYYKADGIKRQSESNTRTYYINGEGYISKIVISSVQKIITNGEVGDYTTEITVICN